MVKIQIQLPDNLYRDLKRLAAAREWSFAEALRRAAERLLARHPQVRGAPASWRPPVSDAVGWRGLSHEAVRAAALDDMERRLGDTVSSRAATPERTRHDIT